MKTLLLPLVLVSTFTLMQSRARGAAGDLDLAFDAGTGVDGVVSTVAVQPDGKVIISGSFTTVAGLVRKQIARLNPDGTGDPSFDPGTGINGTFPNSVTLVLATVLQPDGKVLIGGSFSEINGVRRNGITRLNADGSLDRSFDPGTGPNDLVTSLVLQPNGKIVMGGYFTGVNGSPRQHIARLNADGSLDSSFNPGDAAVGWYLVNALALQPDGKVLVGGAYYGLVVRLNPDGSTDVSFNARRDLDQVFAIAVQADGRILIGGRTVNGAGVSRLNPDGNLDVTLDLGTGFDGYVHSIAVQTDGRLLVGGSFNHFNGAECSGLVRLSAEGILEGDFNARLVGHTWNPAFALQTDGKILVGGFTPFPDLPGVGLTKPVRLNPDGTLDGRFNSFTGIAATAVLPLPDGKFLVSGIWGTNAGLVRLEASGKMDESFPPLDFVVFPMATSPDGAMILQPDGKIVLVARTVLSNSPYPQIQSHIIRMNADGIVDSTFTPAVTEIANGHYVSQIILQSDGKLLVSGYFSTLNGVSRSGFARLNSDGTLDAAFDPNRDMPNRFVQQMAVQPDGNILIAGGISGPPAYREYFSRLHADGSEDSTFQPNTGLGSLAHFVLQPNGKILIDVWLLDSPAAGFTHYVARLYADGSRDSSLNLPDNSYSWPMAVQPDEKILVGRSPNGEHSSLEIVRVHPDGTRDLSFSPIRPGGPAIIWFALGLNVLADSRVLLHAGYFTSVNGTARWNLARFLGDSPVIISQPSSRTNVVATTAAFSVMASGPGPLAYQWYKDGSALLDSAQISGSTTETLVLKRVRFADAGNYTVVVSNPAGSIASEPAILRVRVPGAGGKMHP